MAKEDWNETGAVVTDECGCVFHEIAPTDGHCEPFWIGKTVCAEHMKPIRQRAIELGLVTN